LKIQACAVARKNSLFGFGVRRCALPSYVFPLIGLKHAAGLIGDGHNCLGDFSPDPIFKRKQDMQRSHFHIVNAAVAALLLAGPLVATAAGPGGAQGQGQGLERASEVTEQAQERKEVRDQARDGSGEGADKAKGKQKGYGEGGRDGDRERAGEQMQKQEKDQVREQRDGDPAQSSEEKPRKRWWWPFGDK
jgi:hypothetical protein